MDEGTRKTITKQPPKTQGKKRNFQNKKRNEQNRDQKIHTQNQ